MAAEGLTERTALVTGASQGIGLGVAIRLASELGCRVEELFSVRPFY